MKVRSKSKKLQATRIFTDRQEPRDAFWNNYKKVKETLHQNREICVLEYYGIGGIGKSTLLHKLSIEMKEKLENPRIAMFDFSRKQDMITVLESLRNQLQDNYEFEFQKFDIGLYAYAKKVGEDMKDLKMKSFVDNSPALSCILETMGVIPTVNILAQLAKATDKAVVYIYNRLNDKKQELAKIENLDSEALYQYLIELFASDLSDNLEKVKEPLVIMFDTYERLVNEMSSLGEPLNNDLWIRGPEGLIQNIPNVLWVIAGREKLKWERFDSGWKDSLETHLLGNLGKNDATDFLRNAGISDHILRDELYKLTQGTPVYLDLCVERYVALKENGQNPVATDFGEDVYSLIERFARYMDDNKKDIVYVLSCLAIWNDEMMKSIASQVLPGFSLTAYEKVKDFSFINKLDNGYYSIHQTVGEILYKYCGKSIKEKTEIQAVAFFRDKLDEVHVISSDVIYCIKQYLKFILSIYNDDTDLNKALDNKILFLLANLSDFGQFKEFETDFEPFVENANRSKDKDFQLKIFEIYSHMLFNNSEYKKALEFSKKIFEISKEFYGESNIETIRHQETYGVMLRKTGQVEDSVWHASDALEKYKTEFGDDDWRTLDAKHVLANSLSSAGLHNEAYEYLTEVVQKYHDLYGIKNQDTLSAYCDYANELAELGHLKDAIEIYEIVVDVAEETFGGGHPFTLSTVGNWASILDDYGDYDRAKDIYVELIKEYIELFGEFHPKTLDIKNNYANSLEHLSLYNEAEAIKVSVLDCYQLVYGEKDSNTIRGMNNLAFLYHLMNLPEKGLPIALKMKALLDENIIKDPALVIDYTNTLVWLYIDSGLFSEAAELGFDLVVEIEEKLHDFYGLRADVYHSTAYALFKLGSFKKAFEYAKNSQKNLQQVESSDNKKSNNIEELIKKIKFMMA